VPLTKFAAPRSFMCDRSYEDLSGCLAPASTWAFRPSPAVSPPAAVPRPFRNGFILPRALRPPQSASVPRPAPCNSPQPCDHEKPKSASLGVHVPLRGISWRRPLSTEAPNFGLTLRPWRFSRLRRLTPPPALRVYFTPQPRPGFTLQGFVPPRGAFGRFPSQLPSCPLAEPACNLAAAPASPPRTSGLCSPRRVRWSRRAVKPAATPRPS